MKFIVVSILLLSISMNVYQKYQLDFAKSERDSACSSVFELSSKIIDLTQSDKIDNSQILNALTSVFIENYYMPNNRSAGVQLSKLDAEVRKNIKESSAYKNFNLFYAYMACHQLNKNDLLTKINISVLFSDEKLKTIKSSVDSLVIKEQMNRFIEKNNIQF